MGISIHRIANNLRPATLDHLGLLPAIEALIAEQLPAMGRNLTVKTDASGFHRRLPADIEMIAYRIVQEGLNNVVKHAGASHVHLQLTVNHPNLIIAIHDDGMGIGGHEDEIAEGTFEHGIGLLGMQERAASVGGKVEVKSRRRGGTTLRAELPYAEI